MNHEVLEEGERSNPWWGHVLELAAKVQSDRRLKYSGRDLDKQDPFTNFIILARTMGVSVQGVFPFYQAIKLARLLVGEGGFADDSLLDSDVDLVNYSALAGGWRTRRPASRALAEIRAGGWVEVRLVDQLLGCDLERICENKEFSAPGGR
jgi:hypothetical protein